jgi:hypothetical protein
MNVGAIRAPQGQAHESTHGCNELKIAAQHSTAIITIIPTGTLL